MPTAIFQVPKVLEDRGVTGDPSPAMAIEMTEGLRSSRDGERVCSKVVSVVVILLDSDGEPGRCPE